MNRKYLLDNIFSLLMILIIIIPVSSCGTSKASRIQISDPIGQNKKEKDRANQIELQLRSEYELWEGTRHKLGGTDYNGVDCSGFVKHVCEKLFDIDLPRTTKTQIVSGRYVNKSELRAGDLVFFKPPFVSCHVGIYLSNGEFVHASKSSGVTISKISPEYWSKYYWTGRRILSD